MKFPCHMPVNHLKSAILLSGGIDSSCVAILEKPQIAYFIDYGQLPAEAESRAAKYISTTLGIPLVQISVNLRLLGQGLMAGKPRCNLSANTEWWPFRNQALITIAAMRAVSDGIETLIVGTVKSDKNRHLDGQPDFVDRMDKLLSMQEGSIRLAAPAINLSTQELAHRTKASDRLLLRTFSCHKANFHCGNCPGCKKRAEYFGW